jgi:hypothetical protein
MRKWITSATVGLAALIILTGCATVKSPVTGIWWTDVKGPEGATSNSGSSKIGTGRVTSYLGVVALGDASINTAARNAGITKIQHVDYESKSILGIIGWYTVTVYGE